MKWLKKLFKRKPKFATGGFVAGSGNDIVPQFDRVNIDGTCYYTREQIQELVVKAVHDAKRKGRLELCTSLKTMDIQTWYPFG